MQWAFPFRLGERLLRDDGVVVDREPARILGRINLAEVREWLVAR